MNLPNKITLTRLMMLPLIVFFYLADFIPYGRLVSALLFVIACLTDFVDGKIARKYNLVTDLGKFFDSIADKCLIMTGLILIVAAGIKGSSPAVSIPWGGVICVILILAREFIISALRQIAAAKGKVLAADKGGKIKATVQFVVVSLYMFYAFFLTDIFPMLNADLANQITGIVSFVLMILLIATTLITIYTGVSYLINNRFVFMENGNFKEKKIKQNKVEEKEEQKEIEE